MPKPRLTVVKQPDPYLGPTPPGPLDEFGLSLWQGVVEAYDFGDRASYEILYQACSRSIAG